jgi:hypothetical protein
MSRLKNLTLFLCFLLPVLMLQAQTRQLNGTVSDASSNQGVISATVKVKGSENITTTNADGLFSFTVPSGDIVLEISSVGYLLREFSVPANQASVTISLTPTEGNLSEVVVTALGITKQAKKLGYAVTTVNGDLLNRARETNIGNSLSGRVAGLKVAGTSSGPAGSVKLLLRGNPSMNSDGRPIRKCRRMGWWR